MTTVSPFKKKKSSGHVPCTAKCNVTLHNYTTYTVIMGLHPVMKSFLNIIHNWISARVIITSLVASWTSWDWWGAWCRAMEWTSLIFPIYSRCDRAEVKIVWATRMKSRWWWWGVGNYVRCLRCPNRHLFIKIRWIVVAGLPQQVWRSGFILTIWLRGTQRIWWWCAVRYGKCRIHLRLVLWSRCPCCIFQYWWVLVVKVQGKWSWPTHSFVVISFKLPLYSFYKLFLRMLTGILRVQPTTRQWSICSKWRKNNTQN